MRVVLDTNIFISAILWKGTPHEILKIAESGKITIVASQDILEELSSVMKRSKFSSYLEQAQISHQSFMEKVIFLVQICSSQDKVSVIKKDPSDDKFLSCAIASQSSFIISGDTHLLELKSFDNIPIVTPKQFMLKVRKK